MPYLRMKWKRVTMMWSDYFCGNEHYGYLDEQKSQYTIQINELIYALLDLDVEVMLTPQNYDDARSKIFIPNYGLKEEYVQMFEYNFLLRYAEREIAVTPLARWQTRLYAYLSATADRWNKMLDSERVKFDWQNPYDFDETETRNYTQRLNEKGTIQSQATTNASTNGTDTGTQLQSVLPQATLNAADIGDGTWGSTSNQSEDTSKVSSDTTSNNNTDNTKTNDITHTESKNLTRMGNNGLDYSVLLKNYRESIINVLNMMLDEMEFLFYSIL